jgi:hypothetical protein
MEPIQPAVRDENLEAASRIQEKFDFYLIGLTFTVLGFAVQTARFGRGEVCDASELLAWAALFVSGIFAFRRLEWTPPFYVESAERDRIAGFATEFRRRHAEGAPVRNAKTLAPVDTAEMVERYDAASRARDEILSNMNDRGRRRYVLQRTMFLAGFLLLMLARGLSPLVRLFGYRLA